jgi:hypothetical protein
MYGELRASASNKYNNTVFDDGELHHWKEDFFFRVKVNNTAAGSESEEWLYLLVIS